jgi:hypothetical protein
MTDISARFEQWWSGTLGGRPLMRLVGKRAQPEEEMEAVGPPTTAKEQFLDVHRRASELRNHLRMHRYLAEAYPFLTVDIGPGSIATYLGSDPVFRWESVWFSECIDSWDQWDAVRYDPENEWWICHQNAISEAVRLADGRFRVAIPDLVENIDIFAAMRGPEQTCLDLMDDPARVHAAVTKIDQLYFTYYDRMYELTREADGSSCFTAFAVQGSGKSAKVQCDFSALMSPAQFREFIVPSLRAQCRALDHSLYHLDGPDAIRHVPALMEIEELQALQFASGAGNPAGDDERWFPVYEQVRKAGKSLWISLGEASVERLLASTNRLASSFGCEALYLLYPVVSDTDALHILGETQARWGTA